MKWLKNSNNPSLTIFRCSGAEILTIKLVTEALHTMRGGQSRRYTNDKEGSRYRNYDAKYLYFIFSSTRQPKNL
jgi:hypothetical protein